MRVGLLVIALGACTDEGAHLTFSAPDGPSTATTYQLVLASPDLVPAIDAQRVTPDGLATESVTYYLQRTDVAASGSIDHVNNFTVLVRPSDAVAETAFIPFVALRDADGALVGMGTFRATPDGPPQPILIQRSEVDRYTLAVEPVTEVDASMPVATREAMPVDCFHQDQTPWHSGIVWRPRVGGELRLVFPDSGGDATQRPLDLDCDGHDVSPSDASGDCDDTRSSFHAGAAEACDGEDTNCDAIQTLTVPCTPPGGSTVCVDPSTQMGVALCDDRTGTVGACMSDPQCLCANGAQGCVRCVLPHATNAPPPNETVPCQPGTGQISTQNLCDGGSPCTVQVVNVRGGWDAKVAGGTSTASFGLVATGVGSSFFLRAKRPEGPGTAIPGAPGHTVGQVDLAIIDASGTSHYMGVDLEMDMTDAVCAPTGPYQMQCSP
jgi:hypothetical protein